MNSLSLLATAHPPLPPAVRPAQQFAAESQGFLSPTGVEIAFLLVGLVTLGAAILTVTSTQLVHSALWLVLALGGLAAGYLLLTAEFVAWVQVLIYVGSVVVLLLFGLMLTRAPIGPSADADSGNRVVALVVALATAATLVTVVVDALRTEWIDVDTVQGGSQLLGESIFRHWVLPFEALSVLLLAALVGAIVLSRRRAPRPGDPPPDPEPSRPDPDPDRDPNRDRDREPLGPAAPGTDSAPDPGDRPGTGGSR